MSSKHQNARDDHATHAVRFLRRTASGVASVVVTVVVTPDASALVTVVVMVGMVRMEDGDGCGHTQRIGGSKLRRVGRQLPKCKVPVQSFSALDSTRLGPLRVDQDPRRPPAASQADHHRHGLRDRRHRGDRGDTGGPVYFLMLETAEVAWVASQLALWDQWQPRRGTGVGRRTAAAARIRPHPTAAVARGSGWQRPGSSIEWNTGDAPYQRKQRRL